MAVEGEPARPTFDAAAIGGLAPSALFALHGRVALVTGAAGGTGRQPAADTDRKSTRLNSSH